MRSAWLGSDNFYIIVLTRLVFGRTTFESIYLLKRERDALVIWPCRLVMYEKDLVYNDEH